MKPIVTETGGDSRSVIEARCALIAESTGKLGLVNGFDYYEKVIAELAAVPGASFVPVEEIARPAENKRIALRHDVDADIETAIRCARLLSGNGIPGAFYLLHSGHYYGRFETRDNGVAFIRHEGFSGLLADLIGTGAEIGLHNDALGVIFDHDADGIGHFTSELAWLRGQGADICGTASHNSPVVYGAECFEIFKGMAVGGREIVHWNGKSVRLQTLDMAGLGLAYEANHPKLRNFLDLKRLNAMTSGTGDLLRQPEWQKSYFLDHPVFERLYSHDAWLIGEDSWILAGGGVIRHPLTLEELTLALADLPSGSAIVVSIHPIYVGKRALKDAEAEIPAAPPATVPAATTEEFGLWWEKKESDPDRYDWMFQHRLGVHQAFVTWLKEREGTAGEFASVLEVGCGRGVFYPHFFAGRHFTGLEFSGQNTEWLRQNRKWQGHEFHRGDIAAWSASGKHDLVFSSGAIDNVPDMDAFLEGMVRNAGRTIYLTAYRGWFPELDSHRVSYSADIGAFYNDISPAQVRRLLERLGCTNIVIEALATGRSEIPFETLIVADVPAG